MSGEEYDRRIVELHQRLPPTPTKEQDLEVRRQELELAIDHRLRVEYPERKRAELWRITRRLDTRRVLLALKYLLRRIVSRRELPSGHVRDADRLSALMVNEFAAVLSEREIRSFFGLEHGERPSLPVDVQHESP